MTDYARLRADINIRQSASAAAEVVDAFPTNCLVEILEDKGEWLKVRPVKIKKTLSGYIPRPGLIFPPGAKPQVFPFLQLDGGTRTIPAVPPQLPLRNFIIWLNTGDMPSWLSANDWDQLSDVQKQQMIADIKTPVNIPEWTVWVNGVNENGRQDQALMDEWIVLRSGGREIFTVRDHYIYKGPVINEQYLGCALKGQIMKWTGVVKKTITDGKDRTLYQVNFYRLSRAMAGWFRGDLTAEYVYPTDQNDPDVEANKQNVFDLTQPILRIPQDPEFAAAKEVGYVGAQYIDIRNAIGKSLRHYCLCGEICVSTLLGVDVIPLLKKWYETSGYWRVKAILGNPKEGTAIADLKTILQMYNRQNENYNSAPVPAQFVKNRLLQGDFAISGCGINSGGVLKANGTIRHWVVIEDVLPVGNSGWVRIYNPFQNREEVYEYNLFMASAGIGTGLWVKA